MNKISATIVANSLGGYDFITKTSQTNTKPFTIPTEEPVAEKSMQNAKSNSYANSAKPYPFQTDSFNFKDWCSKFDPMMYTKTEPARSDKEILKDIAELAKKHARQGTFHEQDEEYLALMKEYISSVSSDRESILNRAVNEIIERTKQNEDYSMNDIYQQVNSQRTDKKEEEKELIDHLLETLKNKGKGKGSSGVISEIIKNGNCYSVNIDHGGGMTTTLNYANGEFASMNMSGNNYYIGGFENNGKVNNAMFYDDNGEIIAVFTQPHGDFRNSLSGSTTGAEIERRKEILAAYNAAHDFAIGKYNPPPSGAEYHKEMYDSVYKELSKVA